MSDWQWVNFGVLTSINGLAQDCSNYCERPGVTAVFHQAIDMGHQGFN